jgi:hypothetical protein
LVDELLAAFFSAQWTPAHSLISIRFDSISFFDIALTARYYLHSGYRILLVLERTTTPLGFCIYAFPADKPQRLRVPRKKSFIWWLEKGGRGA